jgi:hypothetical protein
MKIIRIWKKGLETSRKFQILYIFFAKLETFLRGGLKNTKIRAQYGLNKNLFEA